MSDLKMNLQLFADGGAAGGDGGAAVAEAGDATGVNVNAPDAGVRKNSRKRENPRANVQYGIQRGQGTEQAAPAGRTAEQGTETEETFESLINGKYKAESDAYIQSIVQRRVKENAEEKAELDSLRKFRDAMSKRYNVDPNDMRALTKAATYDPEEREERAAMMGVTVDTLDMIDALRAENEDLKAFENQTIAEQRIREHLNGLARQAEALKEKYPDFDLRRELENPAFKRMTAPGSVMSVEQAYVSIHHNELVQRAMQQQAEAFSKSIKANGARPVENGVSGAQSASTVKTDPTQLDKEDFKELRKRVARGEKVYF